MEKTALEWYWDVEFELRSRLDRGNVSQNDYNHAIDNLKKLSLRRFRRQIEEAYKEGMQFIAVDPNKYDSDASDYYTQTFTNKNDKG